MNEIFQKFGHFSPSIFLFYFAISFFTWYLSNYFFKKKISRYLSYNNELQEAVNKESIIDDVYYEVQPESLRNYYEKKEVEDLKFGLNKFVDNRIEKPVLETQTDKKPQESQATLENHSINLSEDFIEPHGSSMNDLPIANVENEILLEINDNKSQFDAFELEADNNQIITLKTHDDDNFELLPINQVIDRQKSSIKIFEEPVVIDDLKLVEGIGFKIQEILNSKGIYSFYELSLMESSQIKVYLEEAGSRFSFHDPTTWPKQAALARDGEWPALRRFQDELDKGKVVK